MLESCYIMSANALTEGILTNCRYPTPTKMVGAGPALFITLDELCLLKLISLESLEEVSLCVQRHHANVDYATVRNAEAEEAHKHWINPLNKASCHIPMQHPTIAPSSVSISGSSVLCDLGKLPSSHRNQAGRFSHMSPVKVFRVPFEVNMVSHTRGRKFDSVSFDNKFNLGISQSKGFQPFISGGGDDGNLEGNH